MPSVTFSRIHFFKPKTRNAIVWIICPRGKNDHFAFFQNVVKKRNFTFYEVFIAFLKWTVRPIHLPHQLLFEVMHHLADVGVHFHAVFHQAAGMQHRAVIAATKGFANSIE